jgi:hypothetical protein
VPGIRVAHHIRGRIRLKVTGDTPDGLLLHELAHLLGGIEQVVRTRVSPASGSLVLEYRMEDAARFAQEARELLVELDRSAWVGIADVHRSATSRAHDAHHSRTAHSFMIFLHRLNRELKRTTGNAVDLKLLGPIIVAAIGALTPKRNESTPLWVNLLTFSVSVLLRLHREGLRELPSLDLE